MKKSLCKSYYSENRTTDDDPIRTIVNYGRDVIFLFVDLFVR
jgi:hypothetical protein